MQDLLKILLFNLGIVLFAKGCHYGFPPPRILDFKRSVQNEEMESFPLLDLRNYFKECLVNNTQSIPDATTLTDFTVLFTTWFEETKNSLCQVYSPTDDNEECWQTALTAFLTSNSVSSSLGMATNQCIDQYYNDYRECTVGKRRKRQISTGTWREWSSWSSCSCNSAGICIRRRTRQCRTRRPTCSGRSFQIEQCKASESCPGGFPLSQQITQCTQKRSTSTILQRFNVTLDFDVLEKFVRNHAHCDLWTTLRIRQYNERTKRGDVEMPRKASFQCIPEYLLDSDEGTVIPAELLNILPSRELPPIPESTVCFTALTKSSSVLRNEAEFCGSQYARCNRNRGK